MEQVITFDKTLSERRTEYNKLFIDAHHSATMEDIRQIWSDHLQYTIDPCDWQAIWLVPLSMCTKLKLPHPSEVLVYSKRVDAEQLTASVIVLISEEKNLPPLSQHYVDLIDLWPTVVQDVSFALNTESTANNLDMLRFFYQELVMPWEYEDDTCKSWIRKHLEERLKLYYAIREDMLPAELTSSFVAIMDKAKQLYRKKQQLEEEIDDDIREVDGHLHDEQVMKLANVNIEMMRLKIQFERCMVNQRINCNVQPQKALLPITWLVHAPGSLIDFLTHINTTGITDKNIKVESCIDFVLNECSPGDTVILDSAVYFIDDTEKLKYGGCLKGAYAEQPTILQSKADGVLFDLQNVQLQNLNIEANNSEQIVLARNGKITLENCIINGNPQCSVQKGIVVLDGCECELVNCSLVNLAVGILAYANSKITLTDCKIFSCIVGLQSYTEECSLSNCAIEMCGKCGILLETEVYASRTEHAVGKLESLKM